MNRKWIVAPTPYGMDAIEIEEDVMYARIDFSDADVRASYKGFTWTDKVVSCRETCLDTASDSYRSGSLVAAAACLEAALTMDFYLGLMP
jgi:hypothetical protein